MPVVSIIGAALQTPATLRWGIRIADVDVTATPGTNGHRIGVPSESTEIDLEGAGGVSSATVTIDDPDRSLVVQEGDRLVFHDFARDVPRFYGWIQNWSVRPLGISRQVIIEAQGREAVLDWAFIPGTLTIPAGTDLDDAIMTAASAAIYPPGVAPIVAGITGGANGNAQAGAGVGSFLPFAYTLQAAAIVTDTSLRDALRQIASVAGNVSLEGVLSVPNVNFTVDFLGYLRAWIGTPADWADVSTRSGFGSALPAPADPAYEQDAAGACHAVYVVGGNAAGTGLVTDGTNIPGPIARINDSTITTAEGKTTAAYRYMQERSGLARTPLRLETYTPAGSPPGLGVAHPRPGARVSIRDAQLGLDPATDFMLDGATIGFNAGGVTENWEISAGGRRKSAINLIRRLTRGVKSA